MKKVLSVLLSMIMLVSAGAAIPANASAAESAATVAAANNKKAKKQYKVKLKKLRQKYDVNYCIKDITGDGVAEMIADYHNSSDGSGNRFKIYTYKKDEVKCILNDGEYGMYKLLYFNKNHTLVIKGGGHGGSYTSYYRFDGKKYKWVAESSQSDYSDEVYYRTIDDMEEASEDDFYELTDWLKEGKKATIKLKLAKQIKPAQVKGVSSVIKVDDYNCKVQYVARWKKVKGASGYQVKFGGEDGGGKYWNGTKTIKGASNTSFKANCAYGSSEAFEMYGFIKVRAYKKVGGKKVYGKWSKVVYSKVKNV